MSWLQLDVFTFSYSMQGERVSGIKALSVTAVVTQPCPPPPIARRHRSLAASCCIANETQTLNGPLTADDTPQHRRRMSVGTFVLTAIIRYQGHLAMRLVST